MNKSLAQQLHELINNAMWGIKCGCEEVICEEINTLEQDINKLLENKKDSKND
jgi:hypothetical protein